MEREPEESDQLPEEGPAGQAEEDTPEDKKGRHDGPGRDDGGSDSTQPTGNPDAAG